MNTYRFRGYLRSRGFGIIRITGVTVAEKVTNDNDESGGSYLLRTKDAAYSQDLIN